MLKYLVSTSLLTLLISEAGAQSTRVGTNSYSINSSSPTNVAQVDQTFDGNDDNLAYFGQIGSNNTVRVEQRGDAHWTKAEQQGSGNLVEVWQRLGTRNASVINQGNPPNGGISQVVANNNAARIFQEGSNNSSTIVQTPDTRTGVASLADNKAAIRQGSASLPSYGGVAKIVQSSRGNVADIFLFEGSNVSSAQNRASIDQYHVLTPTTPRPEAATVSQNVAFISVRGYGNSSSLLQQGLRNSADITLQGGGRFEGAASDATSGRTEGNQNKNTQTGTDLSLVLVIGSSRGLSKGNNSVAYQSGRHHKAVVWQHGFFENLWVSQGSSGGIYVPPAQYSDGTIPHAVANVSQNGNRGTLELDQSGDVRALLTQGLGSGVMRVTQTDLGDLGISSTLDDARNRAISTLSVSQNGETARIFVVQRAIAASGSIYQQAGPSNGRSSENNILFIQGNQQVPSESIANLKDRDAMTEFFKSTLEAPYFVSKNLEASVVQGNNPSAASFNYADVHQYGFNLTASIEQAGSGSAEFKNAVRIIQHGENNSAKAYQRAGVSQSDLYNEFSPASGTVVDEFYFAGGRRAAEINILQRSSGNWATVEQRGPGQYARVEQGGANNRANILQELSAINATAVIRQSGDGNTYELTQFAPGQYTVVTQNGFNNSVTNVVSRP